MSPQHREAIAVVDLGFGDSGKGSIVDYLTRQQQAHTVIRFNGGAQAAHNVITPDRRHHTFAQFGSGTFVPGVRTYLSRFMLIEPYAMFNEEAHLRQLGVPDAFLRTMIDREALVITPFQSAANRLRELARGTDRHGSCGLGVGETVADSLKDPGLVIRAGDLPDRARLTRQLRRIRDAKFTDLDAIRPILGDLPATQADLALFDALDLIEIVADNYAYLATLISLTDGHGLKTLMSGPGTIIFEGAQGVLLDECYGFAPYTTWSTTTFANVDTLLQEGDFVGPITRMGLLRTYFTRHGAGPFVTEDMALDDLLPEPHNANGQWQQKFRVGHFDAVAARYALQVAGQVDSLVITHVDRLAALDSWQLCNSYHDAVDSQINAINKDEFFEWSGAAITGIKVCRPTNQDHQHRLTRYLNHCRPHLQQVPHSNGSDTDKTVFLDAIEQLLGLPITLVSTGPTAVDKRIHRRL